MAGFLGLGGSSDSYFLEPDDAKTMGDIDYMRTARKVKRTFAKTKGWGDIGASEKTVSAYDQRGGDASTGSAAVPSYTSSTPSYSSPVSSYTPSTPSYSPPVTSTPEAAADPEPTPAPAPKPSSSGDGMDMFRSMARKIR